MLRQDRLDIRTRLAAQDDMATIEAIARLCFGARAGVAIDSLSAGSVSYLVASYQACDCGYLALSESISERFVVVLSWGVHPECRRLGVASELIETAQGISAEADKPLRMVMRADNFAARKCAADHGFRCAGLLGEVVAYEWKLTR